MKMFNRLRGIIFPPKRQQQKTESGLWWRYDGRLNHGAVVKVINNIRNQIEKREIDTTSSQDALSLLASLKTNVEEERARVSGMLNSILTAIPAAMDAPGTVLELQNELDGLRLIQKDIKKIEDSLRR